MNRWRNLWIVGGAAVLLLVGACQSQPGTVLETPRGAAVAKAVKYDYTAYNSDGAAVVTGTFTVELAGPNTDSVEGLWDTKYIGPAGGDVDYDPSYVGPQIGLGRLNGTWEHHSVWLNFSGWSENQVHLVGEPGAGGALSGHWDYSTTIGPRNGGSFVAVPVGDVPGGQY